VTKRILVVDDSESIRTAARNALTCQPGIVICGEAIDGLDALDKASKLCPDLIILDLSMPGINGLETARRLRAITCRAPIILYTLYADDVRLEVARAAGINAVVSKSNLSRLFRHVEVLLEAPI
jgi:CheY-like chemotaxis protein